MVGHAHIERWSLAMHQVIADRIESGDEEPLRIAARNLDKWRALHGGLCEAQAEWVAILRWPTSRLLDMLRDGADQNAVRLRSNSPFAGAIDQQLRIGLLREARAA